MIKISIIIAVYNVSKYLERCLDSVTKQKGNDIEIIIVNDGSTDDSLNICKKYQKIDKRVKIINQNNYGLPTVRNIGFQNSNGEYIWHIDGDDYIDYNAVDILRKYLDKYDIICFNFNYYHEGNGKKINIIDTKKYDSNESRYILSHPVTWNKVFKRSVLDGEIFLEKCSYNDIYLIPSLVYKTNNIVFIDNFLYNYIYRKNSLSNSRKFNLDDLMLCLNNIKNRLEEKYPNEVECFFINYLLFIPMIKLIKEKVKFNYRLNNKILKSIYSNYYNNKYWNNRGIFRKIYIRLMYCDCILLVKLFTYLKLKIFNNF